MHANKQNPRSEVEAGDICAAVGFKNLKTGDTLCAVNKPIVLEAISFPDPVINVAIEPKTQQDIDKLSLALGKLAEEDPTFQVKSDPDTGQTIISGMGELHLEILVDRLKREFKVECNQGQPQVNYKEAITEEVEHREIFKKQTGGRGKFADIIVKLGPAPDGASGLTFVNQIKGGNVPKEFIPAVEKGFTESLNNGPLAGFPVDGLKVTLLDGSYHPVDSSELAFKIAGSMALRNAVLKAKAIILEPIMDLEIVVPEEYMGDVLGDVNTRRGKVIGIFSRKDAQVIAGTVPLREMFGYATSLRSMTQGRAIYTMQFSNYQPLPQNLADELMEKSGYSRAFA
jgi:elongation factor G